MTYDHRPPGGPTRTPALLNTSPDRADLSPHPNALALVVAGSGPSGRLTAPLSGLRLCARPGRHSAAERLTRYTGRRGGC